ncbi:MAG TPA: NAD(P)-binding protein [Nocardioides sp.]|uniref:NAD(P)-binding protein n=1 Tax=Nocardioides sp. TaxID=35761 RepID=UPI002E34D82A|nr:NAD(P)-binding protein [Nocardioides sp.]HEX3930139.1 NAD(P)-binding protein [Nocardioides sp.]
MSPAAGGTIDADYLVVGAGATGMAFTDALVTHSDVKVAMVDRRPAVGGHWLDAYPFVQLHQSSTFYGVASTVLGGGRVQQDGPEAGLHERATKSEICAYYGRVLTDRLLPSGRVELHTASEYVGDRQTVSRVSGRRLTVSPTCRIVDARYLSPDIPSVMPPPFEVTPDARVIPVNDVPRLEHAPSELVVVGSGKTATDAIVWLLRHGLDPDRIVWVRPRDPWMLDRAVVQPDPASILGMAADIMQSAAVASSLDEVLLGLEEAGVMMRLDPSVMPSMARAPTLGRWELDLLRSVERVVRRGHVLRVDRGLVTLAEGTISTAPDAVVVHCAASGLRNPPLVRVWSPSAITLQPIRAGFPCFGAAVVGYVEATRGPDPDEGAARAEKNRLCPPSPYGNTLAHWAAMNVRGTRATQAFGGAPDIKSWADSVALNPARVPAERRASPDVVAALARLGEHTPAGLARLAELGRVQEDVADPSPLRRLGSSA